MFKPKFAPRVTPGCTVSVTFLSGLFGTLCLLGCLFLPSYRRYRILSAYPLMRYFEFSFGLIHCKSAAFEVIKLPKHKTKILHAISDTLVAATNNHTLAGVVAKLCTAEGLFMGIVGFGCDTITTMWISSMIFATCYLLAAMLVFLGTCGTLLFWYGVRKLKVRTAVLCLYAFGAFTTFVAVVQFLLLSPSEGSIGASRALQFMAEEMPTPGLGIGWGFCVALAVMLFVFTLPVQVLCGISAQVCDDYVSPDSESLEENHPCLMYNDDPYGRYV